MELPEEVTMRQYTQYLKKHLFLSRFTLTFPMIRGCIPVPAVLVVATRKLKYFLLC